MYMKRKLFSTCLGAGVMATLSLFPQCAVAAGEPVGADTLTLMTYNVRNANGLDGVRSVERVAAVIRQSAPDVVAVQELDSATARAKGAYILGKLAAATGMTATYGPAISFDGGKYGLGLLSRQRPLSVRQVALPGREERRTMLIVEFPDYAVACIHFSLTEADRMVSLPLVREAVAGMKNKTVFIAGDWNATPESDFIRGIEEDFVLLTRSDEASYPADDPEICIDYIAVDEAHAAGWTVTSTCTLPDSVASDHRPKVVRLVRK